MKPRDIWELMTDLVSRSLQDSLIHSHELILEDALENCKDLEEEEKMLVRETVLGTLHFEKICEGMLKGYCDCMRRIMSSKASMYITAYLMIFQYTVLGGHNIRELLYLSISTPRLVEYLEYMLNLQSLMEYSNPYWDKHYDMNFITNSILRPLMEIAPHVKEDVIQWLLNKAALRVVDVDSTEEDKKRTNRPVMKRTPRVATALEEKSGKLPPEEVRAMIYTIPEKRPPRIDYMKPPPVLAKHVRTPTEPIGFSFLTRKPQQTTKVVEEHSVSHAEEPPHPSRDELRRMLSKHVPVRMTAGAIRREAETYLKQMDEQKRSLEEMEAALHDSRKFDEWQRQEKERESQQREAEFLERKAKIACVSSNAVQKRKAVEEMKREISSQLRAYIASKMESYATEKNQKAAKQRNQASKIRRKLEENRKKAIEQAQQDRLSAAADIKAESKQLREEVLEEEERQKTQRLIVIQEIRNVRERNRRRKAEIQEKNIRLQEEIPEDSTYSGLNICMLREKLLQVKEESARLEEDRRAMFGIQRQQEREKLDALATMCANWRQNTRRAKADELKRKELDMAHLKEKKNEEETNQALLVCDTLKQKRKERRAEYLALKADERRRNNELLLLAKGANDMEEKHWSHQEHGVINRLTVCQNKEFVSGFR